MQCCRCFGGRDEHKTLQVDAARWLEVTDIPVSVLAKPSRKSRKGNIDGVSVTVAGMDQIGLLAALERAFCRQGYIVDSGEWAVAGTVFHGTFDLCACANSNAINSTSSSTLVEDGQTQISFLQTSPAGVDGSAQVDVVHTLDAELRIGLLSVVRHCGGCTVRGEFRTEATKKACQLKNIDTFWIELPSDSASKTSLLKVLSSPSALQESLLRNRQLLEEMELPLPSHRRACPLEPEALLKAMRDADHSALQKQLEILPRSLRSYCTQKPYRINPTQWGVQCNGLRKFMGAGVVSGGDAQWGKTAPALQFTTLFIKDDEVASKVGAFLKKTMANLTAKPYAEFVTTVDVHRQCFVIEKAFLNDICPAGVTFGSHAIAEQIYASVWETGAKGIGEILALHDLRAIKLRDVVNFNTYCLLSVAHGNSVFEDDQMQWTLQEQLKMAGLSKNECKSLPVLDVFLRTCLGKLVQKTLGYWRDWSGLPLAVASVEIHFSKSEYERIMGEYHQVMDVMCQVRVAGRIVPEIEVDYVASQSVSPPAALVKQPKIACASVMENLVEWMRSLEPGSLERQVARKRTLLDITLLTHTDMGSFLAIGDVDSLPDGKSLPLVSRVALQAVVDVAHQVQRERGWSCLVATSRFDHGSGSEIFQKDSALLQEERGRTDAFLVNALQHGGSISTTAHIVSAGLLHLRTTMVDQPLSSGETLLWATRYEMLCDQPMGFNSLVGSLVECFVSNAKASSDLPASVEQSLSLLSFFKEQIGRERAFILCRSRSANSRHDEEEGVRSVALMSSTISLIGDELQTHKGLQSIMSKLHDLEADLERGKACDPHTLFDRITLCVDLCYDIISELLSGGRDRNEVVLRIPKVSSI